MVQNTQAGIVRHSISVASAIAVICLSMSMAEASSNYVACPSCGSDSNVWSDGEFDQVHLARAPATAANLHPQTLSAEGLASALAKLRIRNAGVVQQLIEGDGPARMAKGIVSGLAKANKGQDALFLSTANTGGSGLFATLLGYSGRAYVDAKGLNILFGEVGVDFVSQYRGTRRARAFDFGNRVATSTVRLEPDAFSHPRPDWVVIPLAAIQEHHDSSAKSAVRDEQFYSSQEVRLRSLKRLRDENLISDDEFRIKKQEILKDW